MSPRLKLIVAYDGGVFEGWQSQLHRKTVQDELERAFYKIARAPVRVHGAGRTDAGVHALAQCAHVDLPNRKISAQRWPAVINSVLPNAVRVLKCGYVSENFHARFSARGKVYRYRIWAGPVLPPFEVGRAWHISSPIDLSLLKASAEPFVGKHDFAAFAAKRGKKEENTVRTIRSVRVRQTGPCITIEVAGDGFLYKMVRLVVGAMMRVAIGKTDVKEITLRLKSAQFEGLRFVAPAEGLYLIRVWY